MKRHPSLRQLSDDHHTALVLALRLRRVGSPASDELDRLSEEVRRVFEAELEPHFQVEERWLLPALARAGAADLAERTRAEHAALRAQVQGPWTASTAAALGTGLERHVRFEERVLFPRAEALLPPEELERVARASAPAGRARG